MKSVPGAIATGQFIADFRFAIAELGKRREPVGNADGPVAIAPDTDLIMGRDAADTRLKL